jgi:putative transposase
MYRWRNLTPEQRAEVLAERFRKRKPPHSVPHIQSDATTYNMVTAACFEHRHVIGCSPQRMHSFEQQLVEVLNRHARQVFAWTVLPNHYHVLVDAPEIQALLQSLGQLHGRNSFYWNGEDQERGR